MSSYGVMSIKEVSNNSAVCSVKDGSLIFAVGLGPEMSCCMQLFVGILSYKNFETT
jgi:hypothetical protein